MKVNETGKNMGDCGEPGREVPGGWKKSRRVHMADAFNTPEKRMDWRKPRFPLRLVGKKRGRIGKGGGRGQKKSFLLYLRGKPKP